AVPEGTTRPAAGSLRRPHRPCRPIQKPCARLGRGRPAPGPVAREVPGDAAAARAALQCPLQRLTAHLLRVDMVDAETAQPMTHDVEVFVLTERIERHPQTEAL